MHAAEREQRLLELLRERGFVAFKDIERTVSASPATLRRDLDRLEKDGVIVRVRGGARLVQGGDGGAAEAAPARFVGSPFHENIARNRPEKEAIGRRAAELCAPGESVIIDGGSTTLQMCPHLEPLGLQVLTNSLHIVSALIRQANTRISVPAGTLFREQDILLSPFEDDGMNRYHASKLFMGAAAIGRHGLMQTDVLLVQVERRLLSRADEVVVLADSSKFDGPAGHVVCDLKEVDVLVTDDRVRDDIVQMLERAGVKVITVTP